MQGVRRARAGPWGKGGHMSHVLRVWRERGSGPERSLIRAPGLGGTGQGGAARGPGWGASALGRVRDSLARDFFLIRSTTPLHSRIGHRPSRSHLLVLPWSLLVACAPLICTVSCSLSSERGRVSLTLFQLSFTSRARQKRKGSILRNELRWNHARRAVPVVPHMGYAPRTQRLFSAHGFPHTHPHGNAFHSHMARSPHVGGRWASNGENAMWRLVGIERANRLCGWTFILHAPAPRPVNEMFAAEDRRTAQRRSATVPAEP